MPNILQVLHRVLRAPYEYVYQLALLPSELRAIFAAAPPIQPALNILPTSLSQTAGEQLSSAEEVTRPMTTLTGLRRKPIEPDSDCPICYDALSAQESTIWCRAQCGSNMHAACFATWAAEVRKRRTGAAEVSCPYCRAHWVDDNPTVKGRAAAGRGSGGRRLDDVAVDDLVEVSEGYVNVARELGISGVRGRP